MIEDEGKTPTFGFGRFSGTLIAKLFPLNY
jgi:hypothetical protein